MQGKTVLRQQVEKIHDQTAKVLLSQGYEHQVKVLSTHRTLCSWDDLMTIKYACYISYPHSTVSSVLTEFVEQFRKTIMSVYMCPHQFIWTNLLYNPIASA